MRLKFFSAIFFLFLQTPCAFSGVLDINYLNPSDLGGVLPQNVVNESIKLFGIYTAHRPYTGATSIAHSNTLDILVEASLVKIGSGLIDALHADGIPQTPLGIPAVPMAKLSLRKGFGEGADLGVSGLFYGGQMIVGGDLKIVLHDAEEGPSVALLFGYTYAQVPYAYVKNCSTISPEIRLSQRLYFAEPYLGIGGRYIWGTVSVPFSLTAPVNESFTIEKSGSAGTAYAMTGVFFRIFGAQGLRLGIEGTFDISGYSTLGGVFGLGF